MNERMRRGAEPHFSTLCHDDDDDVKKEEEEEEKLCMLMFWQFQR
jgi:hypothetical protein